jgi:hypothetical protein
MTALDSLIFGIRTILCEGVELSSKTKLDFRGLVATVSGDTIRVAPGAAYPTPDVANAALVANGAGTTAAWAKIANANVADTAAISQSKLAHVEATARVTSTPWAYTIGSGVTLIIAESGADQIGIPAHGATDVSVIAIKRSATSAPASHIDIKPTSGTIDGDAGLVLTNARASVILQASTDGWHVIAEMAGVVA